MIITFLSDTHTKHGLISMEDLPGGDLIIHCGDIMNSGYNKHDILNFCTWFSSLKQYEDKIFIAGNHDRLFENEPHEVMGYLKDYRLINYLEDELLTFYFDGPNEEYPKDNIDIYGTPWQPEFNEWAFNLPRNGSELEDKIKLIPDKINILITHGPSFGILDSTIDNQQVHLGCELLSKKIKEIKPQIHVCGHIHSARGIKEINNTLHINASILNEEYEYKFKPITIDFNFNTGDYKILKI